MYGYRGGGCSHSIVKERATKTSELIARLQELNEALTNELETVKTKERDMILEEKRLRYVEKYTDHTVENNSLENSWFPWKIFTLE